METQMRHAAAIFALMLAAAPAALSQEAGDDVITRFAERSVATPVVNGVAVAGPVVLAPKPPGDIPPTTHEQVRKLMARLDNAYPDVDDARKLAFIADYLDISFRRLWNAYYGDDRTQRPDADARPADARPVDARPVDVRRTDRARPVDKPRTIDVRPVRPAPNLRPSPAVRPAVTRPMRPN
jgi:hypothetical protein